MRLEYKYLVPNDLLPKLREMIAPFVETDRHAAPYGSRGYTVRSIYFDTRTLDFYHDKLAGLKVRKKLRLRGYNEDQTESTVFLEIKRKHIMAVSKNRAPVGYAQVHDLFNTGNVEQYVLARPDFPNALEDAKRFFYYVYRRSLQPIVLIVYEREAYYSRSSPCLRITFDKNLRSTPYPTLGNLFSEEKMSHAMHHCFILEVKFSHRFPSWLKATIGQLGLRQQAVSKYVIGVDKHNVSGRSAGHITPIYM
jgi:hypothetical protein